MPKPDHPPAFQFYPQDFASDSKVEAMSTEAVGAYILLLCKAWREEPPGSLPDDDSVLARWARLNPDRWAEIRPSVLAPFTLGTDSRWHQKRMRSIYSDMLKRRKSRSSAGSAGAAARWQEHDKRMRLPLQALYEVEDEDEFLSGFPESIRSEDFRKTLNDWLIYKNERRENYELTGLRKMISHAANRASEHGTQAVIDAMESAMANSWKGWDHPGTFAASKPKQTAQRPRAIRSITDDA
jgi:uncharacterized protein YdaU (DUF1376 family)